MRQCVLLAVFFCLCAAARADGGRHPLWQLAGRHNTVYVLGSIHVLRPADYPLAPAIVAAYNDAKSIYMEVNLEDIDTGQLQAQMLESATLPAGRSLPGVLGKARYEHAAALSHELGIELPAFDRFAPWFAAEAISQLQLVQLGFQPQSGVDMYFTQRARSDGKTVAGLETVQDQIALFQNMPMDTQAGYLLATLEQAHELPQEVDAMVHAWQRGDTGWFANEMQSELGQDPQLYRTLLLARNRKWLPQIEALLQEDQNCLVVVGTGHLVGRGSVIELLKKDGIDATQL